MKRLVSMAAISLVACSASWAGIPQLNYTCPGGLEVHADKGGPVYINGKEAKVKRFNDNYYEAKDHHSGTMISLARNPDGSPNVTYTGKGGANGVCRDSKGGGGSSGSSEKIPKDQFASYCRGEAAGEFSVKPGYISMGSVESASEGDYKVYGTADVGHGKKKKFHCRFGDKGRFKKLSID